MTVEKECTLLGHVQYIVCSCSCSKKGYFDSTYMTSYVRKIYNIRRPIRA
jgi:hypothetical protein